jgi:WD40 repeat protein
MIKFEGNHKIPKGIQEILANRDQLDQLLKEKFTKPVAVMFADLKGSTEFFETHGDFSPNRKNLASGSNDNTIRLWDLTNPNGRPTILRGHEDNVYSTAFSPDGKTLASGSADRTVRLWNWNIPRRSTGCPARTRECG